MRKLNDLFKDLGFNENASLGAREAFVKNLIRAAYGVEVTTPTEKRELKTLTEEKAGTKQLSFALSDLVAIDSKIENRKRKAR